MKPAPFPSALDRRRFLCLSSIVALAPVVAAAPAVANDPAPRPPRRVGGRPDLHGRWFAI